jgi:hypothetical protein
MPPLGNELPLTLQIKNLVSKGFSPFFYAIQAQNLFTTSSFNTMSFLLLGVGP